MPTAMTCSSKGHRKERSRPAATTVAAEFALQQITLTVQGIGDGSGTVTSDPLGIAAEIDQGGTLGTFAAQFAYGTTVTLTGTPKEGSLFAFSEPECDAAATCVIGVTADRTIATQVSISLPPTITTLDIPAGLYNRKYEQQFEVTDGWGPLAWSLGSGELPPGLTLSSDGLLSGTISAYEGPPGPSYEFEVRVEETDFLDRFDLEPFGITVEYCGVEPDFFVREFTTSAGSNPAIQTIRIWEGCGGALDWSATPSESWISISPASGTVEANGAAVITLSVDASGFAPGLYNADIQLNVGVEVEFVDVFLTVE